MALPNQLDDATPLGSDAASTLDQSIRGVKTFLIDIFGQAAATSYAAGLASTAAAGLQYVTLQDASADVAAAGRLGRNGIELQIHDGNGVRQPALTFVKDATETTVSNTTTATTLFTTVLPAALLSAATNGSIRFTVIARVTNTSGAADDLTLRGRAVGGISDVTFATLTKSVANGASDLTITIEGYMMWAGSNARGGMAVIAGGTTPEAFGQASGSTFVAATTLSVTAQWATAAATISLTKSYAIVEWEP